MGEVNHFSLADFDHTVNVNVRAVFVATQAAVRHIGQGGTYGRVITIGSTNANANANANADRVPWAGFTGVAGSAPGEALAAVLQWAGSMRVTTEARCC
jgi:NAD(P)-dependent dehydrogenase (short-subunit alcohol dehydrogenase family)